jgi:uncharacterized protein
MVTLTANESRVLGTLIEKAQTVPAQYPITLNSLVLGCNQKNNREPVTNLSEDDVLDALDSLRNKKLAAEVMLSGSRVSKYRHLAREALGVSTPQLVILAELLLRGPQSTGELRGRASRMHALDSLEAVQEILNTMMEPGENKPPLVRSVPPAPGTRATRFIQLLSPDLHPLDTAPAAAPAHHGRESSGAGHGRDDAALMARIEDLEREMESLRGEIRELREKSRL